MPYRTPLQEVPGDLVRSVRGIFDFETRSTRTEVWTYLIFGHLIVGLLSTLLVAVFGERVVSGTTISASILTVAYCAPMPALFSRRLHDIGWSGWFAILLPLAFVVGTLLENASPRIWGIAKTDFGWPGMAVMLTLIIAICAVSLMPPMIGPNRYGADPRLDAPQGDPLPTNL